MSEFVIKNGVLKGLKLSSVGIGSRVILAALKTAFVLSRNLKKKQPP